MSKKPIPASVREIFDTQMWTIFSPEADRDLRSLLSPQSECRKPEPDDITPIELPDFTNEMPIHCSATYHIVRLPNARLALALYNVMSTVAHESRLFFVSLQRVADYLGTTEKNVRIAKDVLVKAGWILVVEERVGCPTKFKPVRHEDWALAHSNECCKKIETPWSDGDPLGRRLFGLGGRKVYGDVLNRWRETGLTDDEIYYIAKSVFIVDEREHRPAQGFGSRVGRHVRDIAKAIASGERNRSDIFPPT